MHRQQGLVLSVYVDDIKLAGMKQNIDPVVKKFMKHVGLESLHRFLITCTWDTSNANVNQMKVWLTKTENVRIADLCRSN